MMYAIDPLDSIDSFSGCAVRLTALYQDKKLAVGSGVIAQIAGGRCLVTARHVLSGRDPETSQPLRSDGALPNKIQVEGCNAAFAANLYEGANDPNSDQPQFGVHPRGLFVSQTCYIIGFPEDITHRPRSGVVLPIWKTGHIANEPNFDWNGELKLLIDATTRSGMSGAMVVTRNERQQHRFIGIYTGRCKRRRDRVDERGTTEPAASVCYRTFFLTILASRRATRTMAAP